MTTDRVLAYLAANQDRHLKQLLEWLRMPSISSQRKHRADVVRAARFVADELRDLGLTVDVCRRGGHPLVYAESEQRPDLKTLLFYGHYDVQPVDPLDQWTNPPFEPVIEDGKIRARGASDDKGQVYCHLKAVEAYVKQGLALPVNVKFIIEGEEECGGRSIYDYTEANADRLACDAVVISDTTLYNETTPAICYSLKGIAFMEIHVRGPAADLHSGSYGGTVQNPANAICEIVAQLKDRDGRCRVPGFYDDVVELDAAERAAFASLNYTDEVLRRETGVPGAFGEAGYTTLERMWARPTCDVNGITSGYGGEGAKTIIPASAVAKVSMRLVPNQDPAKIARAFAAYVEAICPTGVSCEVVNLHNAAPVLVPRDSAMVQAGLHALEVGFGARPVFIREGGSIPIVGTFQQYLKAPVLLLGYGLSTDNIHSPNESFHVRNFVCGCRTTAVLLANAG
ncbi:MAG TPA: dipeptidase [Candidatus Krumholzibacteria bacterium]|nr:dipeptidase [Candidatus Krumholzibacteria bacterium]HPD72701.1 dipeptidase [Candidatus Krumholzibacteria bacterium]HRY40367.1 dipeptidase [Candidatus Krumholzibacteria bacterium]